MLEIEKITLFYVIARANLIRVFCLGIILISDIYSS